MPQQDTTALEIFEQNPPLPTCRFASTRVNVKRTTRTGYNTVLNFLREDDFGLRLITDVTTLEAKKWLIHLQADCGKGFSSICGIRGVLRPAFRLVEEDMLIRKNPFNFELVDVLVNDSVRREAVSSHDEKRFLEFVRSDGHYSRYYDAFLILLVRKNHRLCLWSKRRFHPCRFL